MSARSATSLPVDLLDRPADEAVRRIALREIERADRARAALVRGDDPEALHDFRVAIRRLRSHLRAYRDVLDGVPGKKLLRRLKKIGADTNPGRDAEVGLAWVESLSEGLSAGHRRGAEWLGRRLTERRDSTYRAVAQEVVAEFGDLAERLRERLGRYTVEVRLDRTDAPAALDFRSALAAELDGHASELDRALGAIASVADEEQGHQARIEAKRLRYLLEPVAARLPGARKAVGHLKSLQDRLGELHDLQVLAAEVAQAVAEVAGERARRAADAALAGADADGHLARAESRRSERPGLLALARRIGSRRDDIFASFEAQWLGERGKAASALAGEIRGLIDELSPDASSPAESPAP